MAEERAERLLAAILTADLVGPSRFMEQDVSIRLLTMRCKEVVDQP
jgi:hypothetical protein